MNSETLFIAFKFFDLCQNDIIKVTFILVIRKLIIYTPLPIIVTKILST